MFPRLSICILSLLMSVFFSGCFQSTPVTPDINSPDSSSEVIDTVDQFINEIYEIGIENGTLPESENHDAGNENND